MNNIAFPFYKKLLLLLIILVLLAVGVIVGIPRWLGPSDPLQKADAIVAISGGDTDARTAEAVKLQKEEWAPNLIFSGAAEDPQSPSNAEIMRQAAINAGVLSTSIDIEELAGDTLGNAAGTAKIIRERGYKKIILVTSKYHQRRASLEFHRMLGADVQIINHPAPGDRHWPEHTWWTKPYSLLLALLETVKSIFVWVQHSTGAGSE